MFRKLDLFPSSGEGGKATTQLGPLETANLNQWLRTETDPVPKTSSFLFSRIPDDGKSPKTQQFYVLYIIVRTL
jgi:hypothetical protein